MRQACLDATKAMPITQIPVKMVLQASPCWSAAEVTPIEAPLREESPSSNACCSDRLGPREAFSSLGETATDAG